MPLVTYPFPMTGGIDRSVASVRASHDSFYNMHMLRQSRAERGKIEQTPYFSLSKQLAQATISDGAGGSTTESSTSPILGMVEYYPDTDIVIMQKSVWSGNIGGSMTQMKVYVQTLSTTATGLQSGCFLTIEDESVALALNGTVDIVIDGATTFKWRINGGAYTTLVPITTAGVSINSSRMKVWFLTTTEFTIADSWTWTRYDTQTLPPISVLPNTSRQVEFVFYDRSTYFLSYGCRLFKIAFDSASSTKYCISAGYRPVFGHNLTLFAKHLFVAGAVENLSTIANTSLWVDSVSCSDLNNLDNFIQTDTNEADTYRFSENTLPDLSLGPIVCGFFVTRTVIYIILRNAIRYSTYLGLPTVFNFEFFSSQDSFTKTFGDNEHVVIQADTKVYIYNAGGLYTFDGGSVTSVGAPIAYAFSKDVWPTANTYLSQYQELYFMIGNTIYCFQEKFGTWHTRAGYLANAIFCFATDLYGTTLRTGNSSRSLYIEDNSFELSGSGGPVKDAANGTTYSIPVLQTHLLSGGRLYDLKEFQAQTFVGVKFITASGTYTLPYVQLNSYNSTDGSVPSVTADTTATIAGASTPNLFISKPRFAFHAAALELQILGDSGATVAPGRVNLYALETVVKNLEIRPVVK